MHQLTQLGRITLVEPSDVWWGILKTKPLVF